MFPHDSRRVRRGALTLMFTLTLTIALNARAARTPNDGSGQTPASQACIALMLPSVQGAEGSATDLGNGVRDLFASFLTGPAIKTVALDARLESQAIEEARQKHCEHVLVTSLILKHGGGGLMSRAIGQGIGTAAWQMPMPMPGASAAAAIARTAVAGGAQTVSTLMSSTKAKDEMRLEYHVASLANPALATPRTDKAKARSDREDLLTPLAERAAKTIVSSIVKP